LSDSHAFIPSFVAPPHRSPIGRGTPPTSGGDPDPEDTLEDADFAPAPRPAREGLPPSYRMRAEPHYVEALARPRVEALKEERPDARAVSDARVSGGVSDRTLAPVSAALAQAVDAIRDALAGLPMGGRPLAERMAVELARAEAVRAGWLAQSVAVLQSDPLPALDQVDLGGVLSHVAKLLEPEHRITGAAPAVETPDAPVLVFGDFALLTVAVGGMLHAIRTMIEPRADAIRLIARIAPRPDTSSCALEVVQTAVRLPLATQARFFEGDWGDHPAGRSGAVLLAAARRIALVQGGSLEVKAVDGGGSRLLLTMPAAGLS
jgi:two-component system sensor histidine kinase/response regulator